MPVHAPAEVVPPNQGGIRIRLDPDPHCELRMILASCSAVKELREVAEAEVVDKDGTGAGARAGGFPGSDPERRRGVPGGVGMVDDGGTGRGD